MSLGAVMSGGRKFGSSVEQSAEERLDEIERKYGVIQQRIQAYDQVLHDFESLKKEHQDLRMYCKHLEGITEKESQNLLGMISKNSNSIVDIKNIQDSDRKFSNDTYEKLLSSHRKNVEKSDDLDARFLRLFELLNEHIKNQENINSVTSSKVYNFNKYKDLIEKNSKRIDDVLDAHSDLVNEIKKIRTCCSDYSQKSESLIKKIPEFSDWAATIYWKTEKDLENASNSLNKKIETGISNVRAELKEDPLTVESVKKEFKKTLESLELDSKNAYLKSSNAAQQIQILEKKIENVNLILKKNELSK
jgi:predicted  nucleic acid-binding Zn-ribbon protein